MLVILVHAHIGMLFQGAQLTFNVLTVELRLLEHFIQSCYLIPHCGNLHNILVTRRVIKDDAEIKELAETGLHIRISRRGICGAAVPGVKKVGVGGVAGALSVSDYRHVVYVLAEQVKSGICN